MYPDELLCESGAVSGSFDWGEVMAAGQPRSLFRHRDRLHAAHPARRNGAYTRAVSTHPLDPLTGDEIRRVAETLRHDKGVDERWRFATIMLHEPAKAVLRAWQPGQVLPREAEAIVWSRADGEAYEAIVDLVEGVVRSWLHRPGVQPCFTHDEFYEADAMLRAHPDVATVLARHGIADLDLVLFDTWAYGGALVPEVYRGRRVGWTDVWIRDAPDSNPYAHFVGGLHCIVDMNAMELLEIEDTGPPERPATMGEYVPAHIPGLVVRDDLLPLEIVQPDGVSFTLEGHELRWQRWSLRLGFNGREGLVFHQVGYEDEGRVRSIAHRMSFAEMVVPYRDPTPDHYRRTAFDIGEWGLGFAVTSLELGCDCLGEIVYADAPLHDSRGEPIVIKNAICIHEEDNAVLWKHVDSRAGVEVRRMRRLVVSFHATVANYEYLDGDHGHDGLRRRFAAVRNRCRRADVRAVPPALHRCPPRSRRRR